VVPASIPRRDRVNVDVTSAMVRTIVQGGSPEVVSNAGHRRLGGDAPTLKPGQHRIGARLAGEDRRPRGVLHRGSPAREPEKRDVAQRWVEGTAGKRLVRAREGRNTGGNLLHLVLLKCGGLGWAARVNTRSSRFVDSEYYHMI
jgi:hypothetical protein